MTVASGISLIWVRTVSLPAPKNTLGECVRRVMGSATVLVTDQDRALAELVSPRETRSPLLADAMLAEALRKGWLTPPAFVFLIRQI